MLPEMIPPVTLHRQAASKAVDKAVADLHLQLVVAVELEPDCAGQGRQMCEQQLLPLLTVTCCDMHVFHVRLCLEADHRLPGPPAHPPTSPRS